MKTRAFYIVALSLFVVGLFTSAYFLYSLPILLEEGSPEITPAVVSELSPILINLDVSVGATLFLGILCIFLLSLQDKNKKVVEKIVYVDKTEREESAGNNVDETDKEVEAKLKEIDEAIKQKRTFNNKCDVLINTLCQKIEASQGIFYQAVKSGSKRQIQMVSAYAFSLPDSASLVFEFGEGLAGQSAKEGKSMKIDEVPDGYISVISGLGSASPSHLLIKPIIINEEVEAVVELASFKAFTTSDESLIEKSISLIANEISKEKGKKTEDKPLKDEETSKKEK